VHHKWNLPSNSTSNLWRSGVPYPIKQGNADNLTEAKFAEGAEIKFTPFTSCIGVVARYGNVLKAVHLVMISNNKKFDALNASFVEQYIGDPAPDEIVLFGCIDLWRNSESPEISGAFNTLVGTLNQKRLVVERPHPHGTFVASIGQNGAIHIALAI
jgi:hypothetical protein